MQFFAALSFLRIKEVIKFSAEQGLAINRPGVDFIKLKNLKLFSFYEIDPSSAMIRPSATLYIATLK